jgi:mannitol-1-phosphate 5-dehydrogenase
MGQLFFEAGYETVFVDENEELVGSLNARGRYTLRLLDAASKREIDMTIERVRALSTRSEAEVAATFADAAVAGTAVGLANLERVAPMLARGIEVRRSRSSRPIDIYLCENSLDAFRALRKAVFRDLGEADRSWAEENVGFVGTVVARMVPAAGDRFRNEDPLVVVADSYHKLVYDAATRRAPQPPIEGMEPAVNFQAQVERKLFSYNLVHAALAYLGYLEGMRYVHEPFGDPGLMQTVTGALGEVGKALILKFPGDLTRDGQQEVKRDITLRFSNPMLMDTIERVARDPIRKLGPEDRLVGAARLCLSQGIFPRHIAAIVGAALCYDHPDDPSAARLQATIRREGLDETLKRFSGLDATTAGPEGELARAIIDRYQRLRQPGTRTGAGR